MSIIRTVQESSSTRGSPLNRLVVMVLQHFLVSWLAGVDVSFSVGPLNEIRQEDTRWFSPDREVALYVVSLLSCVVTKSGKSVIGHTNSN